MAIQVDQICKKCTDDMAFEEPDQKLQNFLLLPVAYQCWPTVYAILTNLAKNQNSQDIQKTIQAISQIIAIVNQNSDIELPQLRKFFTALQQNRKANEKSQDNDSQEEKKEQERQFDTQITLQLVLTKLIPYIAQQALLVQKYWPDKKIQYLQAGHNKSLKFKKHEVTCLLANIFLCTIKDTSHNQDYPMQRTFLTIFSIKNKTKKPTGHIIHKIMCLINYFNRMRQGKHCNFDIEIERICQSKEEYPSVKNWSDLNLPMKDVKYYQQGKIQEVASQHSVEIDFANQYIGGGALFYGCVQEEIMFVISPQLLITLSLCQRMRANEAIIISGTERFSDYKGYGYGFKFGKNFEQKLKVPKKISAIDALYLRSPQQIDLQFSEVLILRQLNKANVGFMVNREQDEIDLKRDIVTGKWGCGAFNGNAELKFILQWLASSAQKRNMIFCGFNDKDLAKVPEVVQHVLKSKVSIGDFFKRLLKICLQKGFDHQVFRHLLKIKSWK